MSSHRNLDRIFALGLVATGTVLATGPCDIYAAAGTACVAAHSTTRALYAAYDGPLYEVIRGSDNTTILIAPVSAGGVADAAAQDTFCEDTTCLILGIFDQSGNANNLWRAPPGAFDGPNTNGSDNLASAIGAPVTLNGAKAYGVFMSPGTGYRNDATTDIATGNEAEGLYAVMDATHYNDECCYDYGNAEISNTDTGAGHMEAIYLGNSESWSYGAGDGPWVMADMEDGLFAGYSADAENSNDPTVSYQFTTATLKGEADEWEIRGGDAQSGTLTTYYSGIRPSGYATMYKEGAIILGIGGDNSNGAQGTFYEGVMTTGYPSNDTEASVQANIVAAKYVAGSLISGTTFTVGDAYSFQATTPGYTARYIAHTDTVVNTQIVTSSSSTTLQEEASWIVRTGLGNSACYSFESVDTSGSYIRHYDFALEISADDGTKQMHEDATFCPQTALDGEDTPYSSIRSWSYPTRYWRHYDNISYAASNGGPQVFDSPYLFNDDTSFVVHTGFAS